MTRIKKWRVALVLVAAVTMSACGGTPHTQTLPNGCAIYEDGSATCPADSFPSGEDPGLWSYVAP